MSIPNEDQQLLLGPLPEPNIVVPSEINKYLKPCQQSVVRFLYTHYFQKDGGILSDGNELHDVLPIAVFISALVNRAPSLKENILIIINDEDKRRVNLWLNYLKHTSISHDLIKYCGKQSSSSAHGSLEPCVYLVKLKRLDDYFSLIKKTKWTLLVYDHFSDKTSLANILNYIKNLSIDCKFIVSKASIFHSKKYFWSLFKFINKALVLGKTWQVFEETGYQYYFNNVDQTSNGKMSKMDIYRSLEATRIRFEYISRSVTCHGEDLHDREPWNVGPSSDS